MTQQRSARGLGLGLALTLVPGCGGPTGEGGAVTEACAPLTVEVAQHFTEAELAAPDAALTRRIYGFGVAVGDLSGDGWPDVVMALPTRASRFFLNDGAGHLEISEALAVDGGPLPSGSGVAMADVDADGDLDLFLGRGDGQDDVLLYNLGGGALTAATLQGSPGVTTTGSFGDLDGDGDLDLFVARTVEKVNPDDVAAGVTVGPPQGLYRNDGGRLVDISHTLPAAIEGSFAFEGVWLDVDDDGDQDLYLVNDWGMYAVPNTLMLNDGAGRLTVEADCGCDLAQFGMSGARGDANGDGAADFFVTDISSPALLLADGRGKWYDASDAWGVKIPATEDRLVSWGSILEDLDRDGWDDLAVVYGTLTGSTEGLEGVAEEQGEVWVDGPAQRDALFLNRGGERFEDVSTEVGFDYDGYGRSLALGDLDLDGRPEIVTAGVDYLRVDRLNGGCPTGLALTLWDGPANPTGIGARVDARIDGRDVRRWAIPSGAFSSSGGELYLGLAGAMSADEVTITWASGGQTTLEDVPAGRLTVRREASRSQSRAVERPAPSGR